jgi:parvulin-like peptidyl-prolyl isomerase
VIEVEGQFLVLKCEGHVPGTSIKDLPPQQYQVFRQRVEEHLRDQKMREAAAEMFKRLQDTAQVKNVYDDEQLRQQMPDAAATINGRPIALAGLQEDCIARHGIEVLDGEINRLLLTQEMARRGVTVSEADLDAEIARAAESYAMTVEDWLKRVQTEDNVSIEIYFRDAVWPSVALKKLVADSVQVTDDDLEKGFIANYGERVIVQAIVLGNDREAQKVWEMARHENTEKFFGELAQQYSVEPTSRAMFGQVPPIAKFSGQPKLEEEAFKLGPGELSGLIYAGEQIVILRCKGRTKPEVIDFEAVRGELHKDILEKKQRLEMAKLFDQLKETAQIDNFLAGTSQSGQPALPPGAQTPPTGRIGSRVPFGRGTPPAVAPQQPLPQRR